MSQYESHKSNIKCSQCATMSKTSFLKGLLTHQARIPDSFILQPGQPRKCISVLMPLNVCVSYARVRTDTKIWVHFLKTFWVWRLRFSRYTKQYERFKRAVMRRECDAVSMTTLDMNTDQGHRCLRIMGMARPYPGLRMDVNELAFTPTV